MILLQAIDLGTVTLELSGFAMFNATWIMILLYLFSREKDTLSK